MKYYGIEDIRINHQLNKNSIVFEVGGWNGYFSEAIMKEFDCYIYIFEPVKQTYKKLVDKYSTNKKVKIFNYGIEKNNELLKINISNEATSLYKTNTNNIEEAEFKNINVIFEELSIKKVDLIELNCEGSEYNIIESISEKNLIKIMELQVQFHQIGQLNKNQLKQSCYNKLQKTHNQEWCYEWFENWKNKNFNLW